MFKLSKLTDYAVVVLVRLARQDGVQTSPGIAAATFIPEPTVAKVLKALAGKGRLRGIDCATRPKENARNRERCGGAEELGEHKGRHMRGGDTRKRIGERACDRNGRVCE